MKYVVTLAALVLLLGSIGCGGAEPLDTQDAQEIASASDHDHEQPQSFASAVKAIDAMGSKITEAFSSGKPGDAHDDLHEIGHSIESLSGLAKQSGVKTEDLTLVQTSADALMDAFGKLDDTLHGGDSVDIDEVTKSIETQVGNLSEVLSRIE